MDLTSLLQNKRSFMFVKIKNAEIKHAGTETDFFFNFKMD